MRLFAGKASLLLMVSLFCVFCGPSEQTRQNYARHCAACHETGAGGAPARNARIDWQIRRNQDPHALVASVRRGLVGMPPSGRCLNCSDQDLFEIIQYMRN